MHDWGREMQKYMELENGSDLTRNSCRLLGKSDRTGKQAKQQRAHACHELSDLCLHNILVLVENRDQPAKDH